MKMLITAICLTISLTGCTVGVRPSYIGPSYVSPGVGYYWRPHPVYGWGWYHPVYGWHRGW